MPIIDYTGEHFPATHAHVNGLHTLTVTWWELVWAAVTTGKALGDEFAHGTYSIFEGFHRAYMLYAYLRQSADGHLQRSAVFESSDPTEKGAISYSLGMIMAKLFASHRLNAPRMLHYAVYHHGHVVALAAGIGNSRPDLIGLTTTGEWIVFEAKGRSNGFSGTALAHAKDQAGTIATIDGVAPVVNAGSITYFSHIGLEVRMDDPKPEAQRRRLSLKKDEFRTTYDNAIKSLVSSREATRPLRIGSKTIQETVIREVDISIGLTDAPIDGRGYQATPKTYVGGDGLVVTLGDSWSEDKMTLEPNQRR